MATQPPTTDALLQIGRYKLLELIGTGGFGSVYRAQIKGPMGFQEEVAVKVVHPGLAQSDPDVLLALADEARILSRLRHPNVVGLRGFEEVIDGDDVQHLLVLEFVRGITLDHLLVLMQRLGRPLPLSAILVLWDDALAGLDHAHRAEGPDGKPLGLVHRDLKPPNLMVDETGGLRILDFGIAFARERLVRTMVGTTKGSPPWMSPEQVRGDTVDRRCDLWVLATIVYRLLAGQWWVRPMTSPADAIGVLELLVSTRWRDRREALDIQLSKSGRLPMRRSDRRAVEDLLESMLDFNPNKRPEWGSDVRPTIQKLGCWDPEAGRRALSRVCRGILKTGIPPNPGAVTGSETRPMTQDEVVTKPGAGTPT